MRFKLIKWTRQVRIWLGGRKSIEEHHRLFKTKRRALWELAELLRKHGYYYNTMSHTYKHQIYTSRKLLGNDYQIHLRFYSDGWVSGHYEIRPDSHPLEHLEGVELKPLYNTEILEIMEMLGEIGDR